jgi:sugar lactone lactonase YvrE
MSAELVLDARSELGEGPCWDPIHDRLIWVDITRALVHFYEPSSGRDTALDVGQPVGCAARRASGGLILGLRDGFALLDSPASKVELVASVEHANDLNRMNDGKCDPQGRFWAGTMAFDSTSGAGALYRFDLEHGAVPIVTSTTVSNGIDWSPDERTMYYVDSGAHSVDAFDWDGEHGTIGNRRPLIEIQESEGVPDGMTVDADGYLWVAIWDGWAVRRYAPDGTLDRVVEIPVARVTSCVFGGPDLSDLYVTSASIGLDERDIKRQPHAGGLFRVRTGIRGRHGNVFAG